MYKSNYTCIFFFFLDGGKELSYSFILKKYLRLLFMAYFRFITLKKIYQKNLLLATKNYNNLH